MNRFHRSFGTGRALLGAILLLAAPSWLAAQDYYADIRPVLLENCIGCHSAEGIAWSMEDPDEAFQRRYAIALAILDRRMPPWIAEGGHQEYHDDPSLPGEVLRMVERWQAEGFPLGDPRPDPAPAATAEGPHDGNGDGFAPDFSLDVLPGGAYLPDQTMSDDYRCFVVDWPRAEPAYLTGFRAAPGNLLVAHHVVVYAVAPDAADRFRELADDEEGHGYQCFGGAVPNRLSVPEEREAYEARYPDGVQELNRSNFWLAHWAPGMDGHRFPEGTGIRVEPGSALVVQMHYYGREAPGEQDEGSQLDFEIERSVDRPAFHLPQTRNDWLAGERNGSMVIEPGQTATYELTESLGDLLPYISRVTGVAEDRIEGVEVHSANLHMHAFGHSGEITLRDPRGRVETLLSVPRWDLRWQRDFTFEPKSFSREELPRTTLSVRCTFLNTRTETVYGGFGSFDEMCFNFSYIALRLDDGVTSPEAGDDRSQESQRERPREPERP